MVFDEKTLVEDYIVNKLIEKGWKFVPAEELERDSFQEPLLIPNLIRAIECINKGGTFGQRALLGDEEINKVLNELKLTSTGMEGAKRILNLYKLGVPVKFEKDRVVRYIRLFDYENIENNEFIVTSQVNYDGREGIRTDVMLYINGIPLVNIECKNPTDPAASWYRAYAQIKDYEEIVPELFKYAQIGVVAETKARYFPIVPWQREGIKTNEWREDELDSIDSVIEMLSPERLLDILKNFLFFRIERGEATKVITRYMQYRAANKIVNRVISNLHPPLHPLPSREGKTKSLPSTEGKIESRDRSPNGPKTNGLIWHWQGSGKTLTMIFAANKLYYAGLLENPSVFFIVDRIELEDQLYSEFYSLDIVQPEIIGSIDDLKKVLSYDDYRGKRGVFIVLIHKFRPEELKELHEVLKGISESKETIANRENVIAFIDEGHRSQYGMLAAQMKAILKSAFFFALTGTPISKKGRDTYLEFSYPPEEPYLDRYFITDSIKDGFTVKIVYQPRLEEEVHLKKELLEAFLEIEEEELPDHVREEVEEKVKQKLNLIKLVLENPKRIEVIARDMAQHFKENIDGKFKAMVVAASRKACKLYKDELDKWLPSEYSEVVMTANERGETVPEIQEWVAEAQETYYVRDLSVIRKGVVEKFKEQELPKILIVTNMLLTGFDAPILQVMYLDKPLKEHRLLQAVARTNRPFGDLKEAGLIIDYVGILKEFKKALEMYSKEDIREALFSYDSVRAEFVTLIKETFEIFGDLKRDYERDTLFGAVEILTTKEEKEKEFIQNYRHLRKIFELLGPDEIKLEYFEDFKWLSAVYTYYMKVVIQTSTYAGYVQKYYEKTIKYVHKSTEVDKLEKELPAISLDEEYLTKLEEKVKSKKEKAANILFALNRLVLVDRHKNPVYESLVERVERLLQLWKEKTKDFERIYAEGAEIFSAAGALSQRQKDLGLSDVEYSVLLRLENRFGANGKLVDEVRDLSERLKGPMYNGWLSQATARKEVEREVRRFARAMMRKHKLSFDEMNDLYEDLMEGAENYGT